MFKVGRKILILLACNEYSKTLEFKWRPNYQENSNVMIRKLINTISSLTFSLVYLGWCEMTNHVDHFTGKISSLKNPQEINIERKRPKCFSVINRCTHLSFSFRSQLLLHFVSAFYSLIVCVRDLCFNVLLTFIFVKVLNKRANSFKPCAWIFYTL